MNVNVNVKRAVVRPSRATVERVERRLAVNAPYQPQRRIFATRRKNNVIRALRGATSWRTM
jgi:hypothetical protein